MRAALLLALPCILLRDQQLLRKRVPFGAALPGKFDGVAQFQKLADLIGIQCLGGRHVYVHSVAARPSVHLHFQYHLALESSRVSVSSCVGQFSCATSATSPAIIKYEGLFVLAGPGRRLSARGECAEE